MADTREQLRAIAKRTGLWLYCQAGVVLGLMGQFVLYGVATQEDPGYKVLMGVGGALVAVALPAAFVLLGWQLRSAVTRDERANPD